MQYTDQLNRKVDIPQSPERIVSLVPSITELLSYLSLDDKIAGITKFCIHPDHIFRTKKRVGGTKMVHHEIIDEINPDLVIANKEENRKEDIDLISKKYPVWVSDVTSISDAKDMIRSLGIILDRETTSTELIGEILREFAKVNKYSSSTGLYLIWKNPYMAAGSDTYINEMMQYCSIENLAGRRYPELTEDDLVRLNPEVVLLSSEPFPFKKKDAEEIKKILPESDVLLADGEYFSWYGSRMKDAPAYFNKLLQKLAHRK